MTLHTQTPKTVGILRQRDEAILAHPFSFAMLFSSEILINLATVSRISYKRKKLKAESAVGLRF